MEEIVFAVIYDCSASFSRTVEDWLHHSGVATSPLTVAALFLTANRSFVAEPILRVFANCGRDGDEKRCWQTQVLKNVHL